MAKRKAPTSENGRPRPPASGRHARARGSDPARRPAKSRGTIAVIAGGRAKKRAPARESGHKNAAGHRRRRTIPNATPRLDRVAPNPEETVPDASVLA